MRYKFLIFIFFYKKFTRLLAIFSIPIVYCICQRTILQVVKISESFPLLFPFNKRSHKTVTSWQQILRDYPFLQGPLHTQFNLWYSPFNFTPKHCENVGHCIYSFHKAGSSFKYLKLTPELIFRKATRTALLNFEWSYK
jgi:hypothetical protein